MVRGSFSIAADNRPAHPMFLASEKELIRVNLA